MILNSLFQKLLILIVIIYFIQVLRKNFILYVYGVSINIIVCVCVYDLCTMYVWMCLLKSEDRCECQSCSTWRQSSSLLASPQTFKASLSLFPRTCALPPNSRALVLRCLCYCVHHSWSLGILTQVLHYDNSECFAQWAISPTLNNFLWKIMPL